MKAADEDAEKKKTDNIELNSRTAPSELVSKSYKSITPIEALFMQEEHSANAKQDEAAKEIPDVPVIEISHNQDNTPRKEPADNSSFKAMPADLKRRSSLGSPKKPSGCTSILLILFRDSSIWLSSLRQFLLCILVFLPGLIFLLTSPAQKIDGKYSIFRTCIAFSVFIAGYTVMNILLYGVLYYLNKKSLFQNWSALFYIEELRSFVSAILWIIVALIIWSSLDLEEYLPVRYLVEKVLVILLAALILFAIKRHLVKSLAMSFNFTNYMARVEQALELEKDIRIMEKSRERYKMTRKQRLIKQEESNGGTLFQRPRFLTRGWKRRSSSDADLGDKRDYQTYTDNDFTVISDSLITVNQFSLPTGRPHLNSFTSQSEGGGGGGRNFYESDNVHIPASLSGGSNSPIMSSDSMFKPASNAYLSSTVYQMSVFDKTKLFDRFFKLVHKTTSQYGLNYKYEIRKEAKIQAARLYKWLRADKEFLTKTQLKTCFDDEKDYNRLHHMFPRELIMEKDLRLFVENVLLERYELKKSLQNMRTAVKKIDLLIGLVLTLIILLIIAISFDSGLQTIVSISSILFSAGFMFQSSAKNALESIVFLFVIHPFDVGDRVYIQIATNDFENLVVSEMHLLSTVFERWDGVKVYLPNYILAMKSIVNIRRSGSICEIHKLQVIFSTTTEQLNQLRSRISEFVKSHPVEYTDFYMVYFEFIENINRLHLNIMIQHQSNWQDFEGQLSRKSKFLLFLKDTLSELNIQYFPPTQRVEIISGDLESIINNRQSVQ